jgi:predicted site-specific integrase-resolvase
MPILPLVPSAPSDVREYLGFDANENEGEGGGVPIALVARVSTNKQAKARVAGGESDLDRQEARLHGWVQENHPDANVTLYSRTSSGMNYEDPTFLRLINDLLAGKYQGGLVVAVHPERICRFGLAMVREIVKRGGAELVFIGKGEEDKSEYETLADDILAVMCHFSAKTYGARAAETTSKRLSADAVQRMIELREANHSVAEIVRVLGREGFKMGTGENEEVWTEEPSEWVVYKYLDANGVETALTTVVGAKRAESPLDSFLAERVKKTGERADKIPAHQLRTVYAAYCHKLGMEPEAPARFGQLLSARGIGRCSVKGVRHLYGVTLKAA